MQKIKLILSLLLISVLSFSYAQQSKIVGIWRIQNVDIRSNPSAQKLEGVRSYFDDLIEHKVGLLFEANGKVNYENFGNETSVYYSYQNDQLVLAQSKEDLQKSDTKSNESFGVHISGNRMTLVKYFPTYTETYTLTK